MWPQMTLTNGSVQNQVGSQADTMILLIVLERFSPNDLLMEHRKVFKMTPRDWLISKLSDWLKWGVISKTINSILIEATNGKIYAGLKPKNHKPFPNIVNEFVGDSLVALFNKSYDLEFVFFIKKQWTSDYLRALNPPIRWSEINYPPIGFEDFIFTAQTIFWWPKMTNFTAVITINNDFLTTIDHDR